MEDSRLIFSFDEGGSFYDHMPPQSAVGPDGIPPRDLRPGDVCTTGGHNSPICDFNHTGYRVPLIVISPFTRKNYVSHTITDYTAILKLIETRFYRRRSLPTPPAQPTNHPCYLDHLQ